MPRLVYSLRFETERGPHRWRDSGHGDADLSDLEIVGTSKESLSGVSLWSVLLGARVYGYDLYDKAPRPMLLLTFAAGFAARWALGASGAVELWRQWSSWQPI